MPKKPSVRAPLPDHLPLETITHDAPCVCPTCCGTKFGRIGVDEREVLEYVASHFKRVRHVREKMCCRACETIVQAPMPTLPIEKGRPGPVLAHVLVVKYCDHLPLHRQSDIYAREGVAIDRSVMAGWVAIWWRYWSRWPSESRAMCTPAPRSTRTIPRFPCSIRGATGRRPAGYGRRCAMKGPMDLRRRRRPSTSTRRTASPSVLMPL
jgi:transposase